jgi:hypothetical protein
MFKRPARLLVAARSDDGRARTVARLAAQPAWAPWLEVRPGASLQELEPRDLEWADLLIALDRHCAPYIPERRPASCRLSRWNLPPADAPDLEAAVARALDGMVGGMRMLARLDAKPDAE